MAQSAEEIVGYLRGKSAVQAAAIGDAMRVRALVQHTYTQRAAQVERILRDARTDRHPSALDPVVLVAAERRA